ncbi:kynureninase [Pseudoduganella aquatica]|uniref:Kynureninase n=1 Tax=Pseudoduganella aquatica TaxID=2660641 RepID=A0A7X4HGK4_9BURK|nr:kynureninase [Pseudoduganella aquatica]MYN10785.1 kynureninase [Pseudoduganella aquatica]
MKLTKQDCIDLDARDQLAAYRSKFTLPEGEVYLDGNSLGAMPASLPARMQEAVAKEWGQGLIRSWNDAGWIDLPQRVAAKVAPLIGATAAEVMVGDSTSVNLFKALAAALRINSGRKVILTEKGNFPTDLYIAQGIAELFGSEIRYVDSDPSAIADALDDSVAVLMLTHVNYRSGAVYDMAALTRKAQAVGALTIWDLAHSAGALHVELNEVNADFAVGCGYKYLNGGPGAPAFVYVAQRHLEQVRQPLSGWHGHQKPFDFVQQYQPAPGINRMQCGTPPLLSMLALDAALDVFSGVDMQQLRNKSKALGDLFIRLVDEQLSEYGFGIGSPRDCNQRGSQVALTHPQGYAIVQALIARGITGDFRMPDILRFGFAPLYVRYIDVHHTVETLQQIMASGEWNQEKFLTKKAVT